MDKKIEKAKKDLKRELTDEDRREYFSNWFANDLDIIVEYIEQLENYLNQISKLLGDVAIDQIPIAIKELQEKGE